MPCHCLFSLYVGLGWNLEHDEPSGAVLEQQQTQSDQSELEESHSLSVARSAEEDSKDGNDNNDEGNIEIESNSLPDRLGCYKYSLITNPRCTGSIGNLRR